MNAWKVILSTLVIFIAGVITGGLLVTNAVKVIGNRPAKTSGSTNNGNNTALNPWMQRNRELLHRMDRELDLTVTQHERIDKILSASQERTKFLWKPIVPQMNKETQLAKSQIRGELNPDQRKKFDGFAHQRPAQERQERRELRRGTNSLNGLTNAISTNLTTTLPTNSEVSNAVPGSQ